MSLAHISLALSLTGIIALFFVVQMLEPTKITALNESHIGKIVSINGTIKSLAIKDGNFFITLDDGTRVVAFRNAKMDEVKRGDKVLVIGKAQLYRNEPEIIAEEIRKI